MKTLRAVFNSVFLGLWTVFMVTTAVAASVLRNDSGVFKRAQRVWARGLTSVWGVEVQVFGAEHMDLAQSYVVMSNHQSWSDIVAIFQVLPIIPGFLAKSELKRVPFLNMALRAGGHVIIDRQRHDQAMQTIDGAAQQVRDGKTVLIFPEGTRSGDKTIAELKSGGFRLAKAAGVPIVPVGLRGSGDVSPKHSALFHPGKIEVHIGLPLTAAEVQDLPFRELVDTTRQRIMQLADMPARDRPVADKSAPAAAEG